MNTIKIAIDGPAGAGKSTISKIVANRLGFIYIDTGAMYRAVALYALQNGIAGKEFAKSLCDCLNNIDIDIRHDKNGAQRIILNGEDVSEGIRQNEVSMAASDVALIPGVRDKLVQIQRQVADKYNVIMDGRDIGTNVLPNANLKLFLTANLEDRARRRFDELALKNSGVSYDNVIKQMAERDQNDKSRDYAPLKKADDAIEIDTTGNSLEQSVEIIYSLIKERIGK